MKWCIAALATLLLNSVCKAFVNSKVQHVSRFRHSEGKIVQSRSDTQTESPILLAMGLKDILPFGKKKDEGDSKSQNPDDIKLALEAIKADLEAVAALGSKRPSEIRKQIPIPPTEDEEETEDPKAKKRQLGGMPLPISTKLDSSRFDESVKDRMARIKSGVMTEEEKAAFLNNALTSTPQAFQKTRKNIPSSSIEKSKSAVGGISQFSRDSLWTQISKDRTSKIDAPKSRYAPTNAKDLNEQAKRQFLERITDPDRFKSYAAMSGITKEPSNNEVVDVKETNIKSEGGESYEVLVNQVDVMIDDRERLASEQKQRALEMQRAGEPASLTSRFEPEATQVSQVQQLPDLLKAQDEYWAKKLEEENRRKEAKMSEKEKEELRRKKEKEDAMNSVAKAKRDLKQAEIERLREEEKLREDPHESEILREAAEDELHDRELNADIIEVSSAKVSRTVPQMRPNDVTVQSFVEERENERAVFEKIKKENQARLAALNSPLPSSTKKVAPTPKPPSNPLDELRKQQQARLASLNSPLPSPTKLPLSSEPAISRTTPLSSPLSKESFQRSPTASASSPKIATSEPIENVAKSSTSSESPRLNLFEMTKRRDSSESPSSTSASNQANIRQKIDFIDDEDDDGEEDDEFFQFTRNGRNSGMSIKDIMGSKSEEKSKDDSAKAKSKMWGIDIDRFN